MSNSGFPGYLSSVKHLVAEVDVEQRRRGRFASMVQSHRFGQTDFVQVMSDEVRISRSSACIAADDKVSYLIPLVRCGRGEVDHYGRHSMLNTARFTVLDMSMPHDAIFADATARLVICVPRVEIDNRFVRVPDLLGTELDAGKGMGRLAARYMFDLFAERDSLAGAGSEAAIEAGINLLMLAFSEARRVSSVELTQEYSTVAASALVARVNAMVAENLHDPGLTPPLVAAKLGISTRYLHRLFEPTGTSVARLIKDKRLDRCHSDVMDPRLAHLTIIEIAFRWGFNDASHFSRAFAERFGCTARQLRAAHRAEGPSGVNAP